MKIRKDPRYVFSGTAGQVAQLMPVEWNGEFVTIINFICKEKQGLRHPAGALFLQLIYTPVKMIQFIPAQLDDNFIGKILIGGNKGFKSIDIDETYGCIRKRRGRIMIYPVSQCGRDSKIGRPFGNFYYLFPFGTGYVDADESFFNVDDI